MFSTIVSLLTAWFSAWRTRLSASGPVTGSDFLFGSASALRIVTRVMPSVRGPGTVSIMKPARFRPSMPSMLVATSMSTWPDCSAAIRAAPSGMAMICSLPKSPVTLRQEFGCASARASPALNSVMR